MSIRHALLALLLLFPLLYLAGAVFRSEAASWTALGLVALVCLGLLFERKI